MAIVADDQLCAHLAGAGQQADDCQDNNPIHLVKNLIVNIKLLSSKKYLRFICGEIRHSSVGAEEALEGIARG